MKRIEKPLTIGIAKQGRVLPEIEKVVRSAGYTGLNWKNNKEIFIPDANILLVLVKGIEEIAYRMDQYLLDGAMIGSDVSQEVNLLIQEEGSQRGRVVNDCLLGAMVDTERCKARLSFLKPKGMDIVQSMMGNDELSILSKYSLVAQEELSKNTCRKPNVSVREIESQADVLAGQTGQMAYDIVSSGGTMRRAGLEEVSGFVEEVGQDVWFEIPKSIETSLKLFNTRRSSQDNRMIDFAGSLQGLVESLKPSNNWGFPDRVALTNDDVRPMWGESDQDIWDEENKYR